MISPRGGACRVEARRYPRAMSARSDSADDAERWLDLDIKLAYQERLIHELDALVREFAARLDKAERELAEIKQAMPPPLPLGALNEPPPHY
jgi:uncharacterized coiled-coil protein SlyX